FTPPEPSAPPPPQPVGDGSGGGGIQIVSPRGFGGGAASSAVDTLNDNVFVFSEHVFFSNFNPDIGEELFVFAYINSKGTNAARRPFTVTCNAISPAAGPLPTTPAGSAMVGFPAGQSDSPQVVVIPYTNTAAGPHIMQIDTSPPAAR